MPAPWASFGNSFQFNRHERPVSDTRWQFTRIRRDIAETAGSTVSSIVNLSVGSRERTIEMYMEPDRFAALRALINTRGVFTDWTRPVPDSTPAQLMNVTDTDEVGMQCTDNAQRRKLRVRFELMSTQSLPTP